MVTSKPPHENLPYIYSHPAFPQPSSDLLYYGTLHHQEMEICDFLLYSFSFSLVTNYVANVARNKKCQELGSHSPAASTYTKTRMHNVISFCRIIFAGDVIQQH
jgi:hypothetical protein